MQPDGEPSSMAELVQQMASLSQAVRDLHGGYLRLQTRLDTVQPTGISPPGNPPPETLSFPASTAMRLPAPEPRIPLPDRFSGDRRQFRAFKNSCLLMFDLQPRTYADEATRVKVIISLLQGDPQTWAHRLLEQGHPLLHSVDSFFSALANIYDDPGRVASAENTLRNLRQGKRPVEDYVSDFRCWSADTAWNDAALHHQFRLGLSESLKDELARVGPPEALEGLIRLSIQIDRRLRERRLERTVSSGPQWSTPRFSPPVPAPPVALPPGDSEPMQLGAIRSALTSEEKDRRRRLRLCLYCGQSGHFRLNCPSRPQGKPPLCFPTPGPLLLTTGAYLSVSLTFQLPGRVIEASAIIDSGACSAFMDRTFAETHCIPLQRRSSALPIRVADGSMIKAGPLTHQTEPLEVSIGTRHTETLIFDILPASLYPLILGLPWLKLHNPNINWSSGVIQFQSSDHSLDISPPREVRACSLDSTTLPAQYLEFRDVFDEKGADVLPPHRPYDCPIDLLPGSSIPFGRIYPLSDPELRTLKDYIDENLRKNFIRPSSSPAGAGIFFVEKKDGSLRPCIDYRDLNKITVKNRYPLPLIPELFQRLQGAKIFTKLDLRGAYNLIRVRRGDEWKTAFRSRYGHFEYLVMPFGLCNAPATFQHLVNDIFRDLLDVFVIVYLDDILVFSSSLLEHRNHVRQVLERLRSHHLFAKLEKCEFERQEIQFLGLSISPSGITMDKKKVSAILEWPIPTNRREVQRFIGFANFYRRFIHHFSKIIQPMTELTRKTQRFAWSPAAQSALDTLKKAFTSAPILRHPNPELPFVLEVDASETAVGAILSQRLKEKDLLHPVAFFSRKLSSSERNYDVGDRELLAIKMALEEWRYLLEGGAHPIIIFTDHKNLEYLRSAKRLRPRQARWALFFTRFNFHITYRPGSKNGKADALSRLPSSTPEVEILDAQDTILHEKHFLMVSSEVLEQIREATAQLNDDTPRSCFLKEGILFSKGKIFVPPGTRKIVLESTHASPLAGHFGREKTTDLTQRHFWWPSLTQDCKKFVDACETCARSKGNNRPSTGLLQPLPIPEEPWTHISMDFIGELPPSGGCNTIWVVVDRFSKMAHFVPLQGLPSSATLAQVFIREVIRLHGVPEQIVSDRGPQFTARFWRHLCKTLKISLALSSAYHPQTNGQTERTNQTLEQYLRVFSSYLQDNWCSLLPLAEFAYNNSLHTSSGMSPFFANYGRHPRILPDCQFRSSLPLAQDLATQLRDCHQRLRKNLVQAQKRYKDAADVRRKPGPEFQVGDRVWLSTAHLRLGRPSKKLSPKFIGPFSIEKKINQVCFKLKLPNIYRIHPVFHVSLLKPVSSFTSVASTPEPVLIEGEEEYEVEEILDARHQGRGIQYLVKWLGFGSEENSWEPAANIHAPELVREFHQSHPEKPRPGVGRRPPLRGGQCHGRSSRDPIGACVRSRGLSRRVHRLALPPLSLRARVRRCGRSGAVVRADASGAHVRSTRAIQRAHARD